MKRILLLSILLASLGSIHRAAAQEETAYDTTCTTELADLQSATLQQLSDEMQRLRYKRVVACKELDSDLHNVMKALGEKLTRSKAGRESVVQYMGKPYFQGTLAEYEGQKVTISRSGKVIGTFLPPMFEVPSGDYYIVYLWYSKKDYLVFALKDGKVTDSTWWHKKY